MSTRAAASRARTQASVGSSARAADMVGTTGVVRRSAASVAPNELAVGARLRVVLLAEAAGVGPVRRLVTGAQTSSHQAIIRAEPALAGRKHASRQTSRQAGRAGDRASSTTKSTTPTAVLKVRRPARS